MEEENQHSGGQREAEVAPARPRAPDPPRQRLRSLSWALGEIVIVTIGILIAFALNAWWQGRALAQEERAHLHALASDFERNVEELRRLIQAEEEISEGSRQLLMLAQSDEPVADGQLEELVNKVFNSARYEPVMGAYEALVNSAGLTLIEDDELRASLARFAAHLRGQYAYAQSWSSEHYFAFTRDYAGRMLLTVLETQEANERERVYAELLREPKFREHLAMRHFTERDMAREYRELLERAEAVLTRVRAQTAR